MSLTTAARRLGRTVRATDRLRLRYTENQFPQPQLAVDGQLEGWVLFKLNNRELALVDEVSLEIRGQWSNYRFPRPEQAPNNDN
jgi:hypothetical protein